MIPVMHDPERKRLMRQAAQQMQHEAARLEDAAANLRVEAAKLLAASEAKSKRFHGPAVHARAVAVGQVTAQEIADQEAAERHERFRDIWGIDPLA